MELSVEAETILSSASTSQLDQKTAYICRQKPVGCVVNREEPH